MHRPIIEKGHIQKFHAIDKELNILFVENTDGIGVGFGFSGKESIYT